MLTAGDLGRFDDKARVFAHPNTEFIEGLGRYACPYNEPRNNLYAYMRDGVPANGADGLADHDELPG